MDHTGEAVYFVNDLSPGQKRTPSQPLPTKGEGLDPAALASAISISHFGVALVTWHWTRGARSPSPLVGRGWGGVFLPVTCPDTKPESFPQACILSRPSPIGGLRPHRLGLVALRDSSPERTASHESCRHGSGRDRRHHGLLSGQGRGRSRGARPAVGAGARDQLRQCGRAELRHDLALGSTGRADEGAQMAVHEAPAAVHLAADQPDHVEMGPADAAKLQ